MRYFRILILNLALWYSACADAEVEHFYGIYSSFSDRTVYGSIMLSSDEMKWTAGESTYVCSAKYQVMENSESRIYPDKRGNIEDSDGAIYEYLKIQLLDCNCPQDLPNNKYFHEVHFLQFAFKADQENDAYKHTKAILYSKDGTITATANFAKTNLK